MNNCPYNRNSIYEEHSTQNCFETHLCVNPVSCTIPTVLIEVQLQILGFQYITTDVFANTDSVQCFRLDVATNHTHFEAVKSDCNANVST